MAIQFGAHFSVGVEEATHKHFQAGWQRQLIGCTSVGSKWLVKLAIVEQDHFRGNPSVFEHFRGNPSVLEHVRLFKVRPPAFNTWRCTAWCRNDSFLVAPESHSG